MLRVKDGDRVIAAAFTLITISFYFVDKVLPDWAYYIVASCFDLAIIAAILCLQKRSNARIAKVMASICGASILLQFVGYYLYVTAGNSSIYDNAAIMFYVIVIAIFMTWNKLDGKLARYISDRPWFFHSVFLRH